MGGGRGSLQNSNEKTESVGMRKPPRGCHARGEELALPEGVRGPHGAERWQAVTPKSQFLLREAGENPASGRLALLPSLSFPCPGGGETERSRARSLGRDEAGPDPALPGLLVSPPSSPQQWAGTLTAPPYRRPRGTQASWVTREPQVSVASPGFTSLTPEVDLRIPCTLLDPFVAQA